MRIEWMVAATMARNDSAKLAGARFVEGRTMPSTDRPRIGGRHLIVRDASHTLRRLAAD
jgi:hypothetical protein